MRGARLRTFSERLIRSIRPTGVFLGCKTMTFTSRNGSATGVSGSSNVVDTTQAAAAATAADISIGQKAYVNGTLVTGTLAAVNMSHAACTGSWAGATCNVCRNGWSGANCDTISKPFAGGAVPTYASTPWKCVSDSTIGLVWEVKTNDGGLHDLSNTYNTAYFPNTVASVYWSGSSYAPDPSGAWFVGFNYGNTNSLNKGFANYVRLVRSGQ